MFVPTEGIGSAVARVSRETGIPVLTMEFYEDRCVVEFRLGDASPDAPPGQKTVPTLPEGPWERVPSDGKTPDKRHVTYRCGTVESTIPDLARDYGVPLKTMRQRIYKSGYAVTMRRKAKGEKVNKVRRMSPDQ